jgi:hypothetical protein
MLHPSYLRRGKILVLSELECFAHLLCILGYRNNSHSHCLRPRQGKVCLDHLALPLLIAIPRSYLVRCASPTLCKPMLTRNYFALLEVDRSCIACCIIVDEFCTCYHLVFPSIVAHLAFSYNSRSLSFNTIIFEGPAASCLSHNTKCIIILLGKDSAHHL